MAASDVRSRELQVAQRSLQSAQSCLIQVSSNDLPIDVSDPHQNFGSKCPKRDKDNNTKFVDL